MPVGEQQGLAVRYGYRQSEKAILRLAFLLVG